MRFRIQLVFVLTFFCGIMFWMVGTDYLAAFSKTVDFNELTADELKANMRVEGDIYAIIDQFANEESWTENKNGTRTPKKISQKYYLIPVGDKEYMGFSARPGDFKKCDDILGATYSYQIGESDDIYAEPIHIVGKTEKMDAELAGYMYEWFEDSLETTDREFIKQYAIPITLETRDWKAIYIMFAINMLLFLADVGYIVFYFVRRKKAPKLPENPPIAVPNGMAPPPPPPVNPAAYPSNTPNGYAPNNGAPAANNAPSYPSPAASAAPSPSSQPVGGPGYATPDNPDASRKNKHPDTPDQP